jgi:multidrug efflux pump subunit AcrB
MTNRMKYAALALLLLAPLCVVVGLLSSYHRISLAGAPHEIVVKIRCPRANAREAAVTIVAPIEKLLDGLESTIAMRSRSCDDGFCTISIAFAPGVDLNEAQTLVENRLKRALPELPDLIQRPVVVTKGSAGVGLILFLSAPDGRFDTLYLSNYANLQLRDQLVSAAGIADVTLTGSQDYNLRIWLDSNRLAALELTSTDVVKTLELNNQKTAEPSTPKPGGSPELNHESTGLGRLATVEQLYDLVVPGDAGRDAQLRHVARMELGATRSDSRAQLDGEHGVALAIYLLPLARPSEVSAAVQQIMSRLAGNLPEGINLKIAFDFTPNLDATEGATRPHYFLLDMDAPAGASAQDKLAWLDRADQVMRAGKEVKRVMVLTDNVFDRLPDRSCVLVSVATPIQGQSGADTAAEAIRKQLQKQVADATFRLRDFSRLNASPCASYPIDFAVHGPERDQAQNFARKLVTGMRANNKLMDVWTSAEAAEVAHAQFEVDANAAKAHGVAMSDVMNALQVAYQGLELDGVGRLPQINVQVGTERRMRAEDLKQLNVRNSRGDLVSLSGLVTLREVTGPAFEERLNGQPMFEITANPAAKLNLGEIKTLCESLAGDVRVELRLPADYRLSWLDAASAANGRGR